MCRAGAHCIIKFKQVDEIPHSKKTKRRGDRGFGSVEVETQFFELMFAATMEGGLRCDNGLPCVSNQPITVELHDRSLIGTARGICTIIYNYNDHDQCFVHLATSDGFAYCLNVQAVSGTTRECSCIYAVMVSVCLCLSVCVCVLSVCLLG